MMTLQQAIEYGKRVGVAYYVKNEYGCIIAGFTTLLRARQYVMEQINAGCRHGNLHVETADGETI